MSWGHGPGEQGSPVPAHLKHPATTTASLHHSSQTLCRGFCFFLLDCRTAFKHSLQYSLQQQHFEKFCISSETELSQKKQNHHQQKKTTRDHPKCNPRGVGLHIFVFSGKQFYVKTVILTKRTVKCHFSLVSHEIVLNMCRYFKYHINVTPLAQLLLYIWTWI